MATVRHRDPLTGRPGWKLEGTNDMPAETSAKNARVAARM
jgi:hypothetical protein